MMTKITHPDIRNPITSTFATTLVALLAMLVAACAPAPGGQDFEQRESDVTVCAAGDTLQGIDVSKWQGTIDWDQVAASGIDFAFIRVSDGINYLDGQFARNWSEARRVGIARGAYQFFRPAQDPVSQANILLSEMGPLEPDDLPPVIDVEVDGGLPPAAVAEAVGAWIDAVESAVGKRPIIYTSKYFWQDNVGSSSFVNYPLWAAHWGVTCPNLAEPWSEWVFHQTSDSGTVPGISGNVDTNVFNGDAEDLAWFMALQGSASVCGDGVCSAAEQASGCALDCGGCEALPGSGGVIDETNPCFSKGGAPQYWRTESDGHDGSLLWTMAVESSVENVGTWQLNFSEPGRYRIEAYTDGTYASSRQAAYNISHANGGSKVVVDQTIIDGWTVIGEFEFADGPAGHSVRLTDVTGEPLSWGRQIVFDALRITRTGPASSTTTPEPTEPTGPGTGGQEPGSLPSVGCQQTGHSGGVALLLALVLLAWRRRYHRLAPTNDARAE